MIKFAVIVALLGVTMAQPPVVPPGTVDPRTAALLRNQLTPGTVDPRAAALLRNPLTPSAVAVTLRSINENVGDGNYRYEYETSDGTRAEQTGVLRGPDPLNPEGVQTVTGSYSYISPEGIPITVTYIADENGFQPIGEHIPGNSLRLRGAFGIPPVVPPVPGAAVNPVAAALAAQRLARPTPTPDPVAVTPATPATVVDPVAAALAPGIRNPYNRFAPLAADPYNRFNPYVNPYALGATATGAAPATTTPDYRRVAAQNPYFAYNRGLGFTG